MEQVKTNGITTDYKGEEVNLTIHYLRDHFILTDEFNNNSKIFITASGDKTELSINSLRTSDTKELNSYMALLVEARYMKDHCKIIRGADMRSHKLVRTDK